MPTHVMKIGQRVMYQGRSSPVLLRGEIGTVAQPGILDALGEVGLPG